jgi:hypothetical protein
MFAAVALQFTGWSTVGNKVEFWRDFESRHLQTDKDRLDGFDISRANEYEALFRERFPGALERQVNDEIRRVWSDRPEARRTQVPKIRIRLLTVEYGSIKSVFDIIGVDNSDLRDFIVLALQIYSPLAFRTALDTAVTVMPSVEILGDDPPIRATANVPARRAIESINQAWIISNTSLLIPVGLAIFICYYVFTSLAHELESVRSEAAAVRAERTDIVKALVDQNTKISASIVEHAKSSASSSHATEELLLNLVKARNGDMGNVATQNKQAVPEVPINNSVAR